MFSKKNFMTCRFLNQKYDENKHISSLRQKNNLVKIIDYDVYFYYG